MYGTSAFAYRRWHTGASSQSYWYVYCNNLGSLAVFESEEWWRYPVMGMLSLAEQWNWVQGSWNDDYSESRAELVAESPGQHRAVTERVAAMLEFTS